MYDLCTYYEVGLDVAGNRGSKVRIMEAVLSANRSERYNYQERSVESTASTWVQGIGDGCGKPRPGGKEKRRKGSLRFGIGPKDDYELYQKQIELLQILEVELRELNRFMNQTEFHVIGWRMVTSF